MASQQNKEQILSENDVKSYLDFLLSQHSNQVGNVQVINRNVSTPIFHKNPHLSQNEDKCIIKQVEEIKSQFGQQKQIVTGQLPCIYQQMHSIEEKDEAVQLNCNNEPNHQSQMIATRDEHLQILQSSMDPPQILDMCDQSSNLVLFNDLIQHRNTGQHKNQLQQQMTMSHQPNFIRTNNDLLGNPRNLGGCIDEYGSSLQTHDQPPDQIPPSTNMFFLDAQRPSPQEAYLENHLKAQQAVDEQVLIREALLNHKQDQAIQQTCVLNKIKDQQQHCTNYEEEKKSEPINNNFFEFDDAATYNHVQLSARILEERACTFVGDANNLESAPSLLAELYSAFQTPEQRKIVEESGKHQGSNHNSCSAEESKLAADQQPTIRQESQNDGLNLYMQSNSCNSAGQQQNPLPNGSLQDNGKATLQLKSLPMQSHLMAMNNQEDPQSAQQMVEDNIHHFSQDEEIKNEQLDVTKRELNIANPVAIINQPALDLNNNNLQVGIPPPSNESPHIQSIQLRRHEVEEPEVSKEPEELLDIRENRNYAGDPFVPPNPIYNGIELVNDDNNLNFNDHPFLRLPPAGAQRSPSSSRSSSSSSSSCVSFSSQRSIPDEHKLTHFDEVVEGDQYINNFQCIMKGITWARDSHGLFDYETRHPLKKQMRTETGQLLVRTSKNNELHIVGQGSEWKESFQNQAQLLLSINKIRNHYYLEAPKMPKNDDLLPQYQSDDQPPLGGAPAAAGNGAADPAAANGVLPSETTERMFLVVRSLKQDDKKLDYKLKKHDIVKLGRVKFKVKEIHIKVIEDEKKKQRQRKQKCLRKIKEEEEKKLALLENPINPIPQANQFSLLPININKLSKPNNLSNNNHHQQHHQQFISSSQFADALEGEESFIEVECVLPQDQLRNQKQWMSHRLKEKKKNNKNKKKEAALTVRGEQQQQEVIVANKDDVTNFDGPPNSNNNMMIHEEGRHGQIRQVNNTTLQNAQIGHINGYEEEDQKEEDQKQEESQSHRVMDGNEANTRNHYMAESEAHGNINRSHNTINIVNIGAQIPIRKQVSNNIGSGPPVNAMLMMKNGLTHKISGAGAQDDEQLVTKMDANEQREVTDPGILGNKNDDEDDEEGAEGVDIDDECLSLNKELPFCRFCWVNETTEENPLLSSCKCRGGVQYVHYLCLKEWVKTKRTAKEHPHISSYQFKQFECEICKTSYPYVFKAANKKYKLIDIPVQNPQQQLRLNSIGQNNRATGDYLVLESLTLEKNTSRIVHVITPTSGTKSIRLGRGHDSDLRINDISVSRQHAVIRFKNDGFYLQDNMSKFGTLVLVRKRLPLSFSQTKAVQVGRTVINFQIKPLPQPLFEVGKFIKSTRVLSERDKQHEELKKVLVNMQQAEDYIKKQQVEHQRLARTDNFHARNDYMRRFQQNIHDEEIKIDPSQEQLAGNESLQQNVNRILEKNDQQRQELLNYMQNNHPGAVNGIGALLNHLNIPQAPLNSNVNGNGQQQVPLLQPEQNWPIPDEELGEMNIENHVINPRMAAALRNNQ